MCTLANCEYPDEMPHHAAFHLGLHRLLRQNELPRKKSVFYLEIITCDPSILYVMFIVSNQMEESISA